MEEQAIITAITELKTVLDDAGLGQVYDHIPPKPNFPCVIIAPNPTFIGEGDTYTHRLLNLDIWVIAPPSQDNKAVQQNLYKNIANAITALETIQELQFDEAGQPTPIEYNQVKTLAAIIEVNITL